SLAAVAAVVVSASVAVAAAQGAAPGVQVSVLTTFDSAHGPAAVAATNSGDVVALAGTYVVSVGPNGQQQLLTTLPGGAFGIPVNPDGSAGTATVWAQVPGAFFDDMTIDDRTGDVYVSRLDTNELLQITPGGVVTAIATHADGILGAANMSLIHVGQNTVIY